MPDAPTATPMGFGPYVRSLREAAGMKQKQVAERIGVSQSHYSAIEAKSHTGYLPAPEIVAGLARVLRVTEADLLRAAGYLTDAIAARRLDDEGDAYAAAQDRWAAEHPDEVQRIADRIRQAVIDELAPERDEREEPRQLNFAAR